MQNTVLTIVILLVLVVLIVAAPAIGTYNRLLPLDEGIDNAWAQAETVLQRRYDRVPSLVNLVKNYAEHEKSLLDEIERLRSQWAGAKITEDKARTASRLEEALSKLMTASGDYADLKANETFIALRDEFTAAETRISLERRRYNDAVRDYNTAFRRFPAKLFAGILGFRKRDVYLQTASDAKERSVVEF
jgi:LemA protein